MHETLFIPRFSETDAIGHIGNTVVPVWFESARTCIFEQVHPGLSLEGWPLIVAHYEVDFCQQLYFGSDVTVKTGIEKLGNSSMTVYQQAWQKERLAAEGRTVLVYFDYQRNTPVRIPEEVRSRLSGLMTHS